MDDKSRYKKLVTLIKLFEGKPHFFAKYLLDNSALKDEFLKKVMNNSKLESISLNEVESEFNSIFEMEEYYKSFVEEENKNIEELTIELNEKLERYIHQERFEDAAKVRDIMKKNNIKKI